MDERGAEDKSGLLIIGLVILILIFIFVWKYYFKYF
jgi:hypothetical protein